MAALLGGETAPAYFVPSCSVSLFLLTVVSDLFESTDAHLIAVLVSATFIYDSAKNYQKPLPQGLNQGMRQLSEE